MISGRHNWIEHTSKQLLQLFGGGTVVGSLFGFTEEFSRIACDQHQTPSIEKVGETFQKTTVLSASHLAAALPSLSSHGGGHFFAGQNVRRVCPGA